MQQATGGDGKPLAGQNCPCAMPTATRAILRLRPGRQRQARLRRAEGVGREAEVAQAQHDQVAAVPRRERGDLEVVVQDAAAARRRVVGAREERTVRLEPVAPHERRTHLDAVRRQHLHEPGRRRWGLPGSRGCARAGRWPRSARARSTRRGRRPSFEALPSSHSSPASTRPLPQADPRASDADAGGASFVSQDRESARNGSAASSGTAERTRGALRIRAHGTGARGRPQARAESSASRRPRATASPRPPEPSDPTTSRRRSRPPARSTR